MTLQVARAEGLSLPTLSENPYSEDINPGTKQGLTLFNVATPLIDSDKWIKLSTKNFQKIMDLFGDLTTRHQW
eukprot:11589525-Ditylum_brightwellii.AAC.1